MMFEFEIPTQVFAAINFLVLYWLLRKFLFKPVTEFLQKRTSMIKDNIDKAEKDRQEANQLKNEYAQKLQAAEAKADRIVNKARERADIEYKKIIESAKKEAQETIECARLEIENPKEKYAKHLKSHIASIALTAASKVTKENMDSEKNLKLVEKFLEDEEVA